MPVLPLATNNDLSPPPVSKHLETAQFEDGIGVHVLQLDNRFLRRSELIPIFGDHRQQPRDSRPICSLRVIQAAIQCRRIPDGSGFSGTQRTLDTIYPRMASQRSLWQIFC